MNNQKEQKPDLPPQKQTLVEVIFNDPEATRNLVGFFELALKVHMRIHPELYKRGTTANGND